MNVAFVSKRLGRKRKALEKDIACLAESCGCSTVIHEPEYAGHAIELAHMAVQQGYDHVIAIGGDGSLNEVVNGILQNETSSLPVLGYLPYGSANDFSKSVGITDDIDQLVALINAGKTKLVDVGKAEYESRKGGRESRYFINIADIGIGGYTVGIVDKLKPMLGARSAYAIAVMYALITYKRGVIEYSFDGQEHKGTTLSLVVANGKYFGDGLCIAPDADITNGKLDLTIIGDVSIFDYLKNLGRLKNGIHLEDPEVSYHVTTELKVSSDGPAYGIDMDGEFVGFGPAMFTVLPKRIAFLMP